MEAGGVVVEVVGDVAVVVEDTSPPSLPPEPEPSPRRQSPRRHPHPPTKASIKSLKLSNTRKDNKLMKSKDKIKQLAKKTRTAAKAVRKVKVSMINAVHAAHVEKKTSRLTAKQIEDQHQYELKNLVKLHEKHLAVLNAKISEAYELVTTANNKADEAENARINAEAEWKDQLRQERSIRAEAVYQMKRKMTEILQTEMQKSLKDQAGMQAIIDHQLKTAKASIEDIVAKSEREVNVLRAEVFKTAVDEEAKRDQLENDLSEANSKLRVANRDKRSAVAVSAAAKSVNKRRLGLLAAERELRVAAEDRAIEMGKQIAAMTRESEASMSDALNSHVLQRQLKKVRVNAENGKPGGGMVYPQWVMTAICELLTCGASPSSIGKILKVMYQILYDKEPEDVPCINYIRRGRMVLAVFNETMSAMKLAIAESWDQLCTDATTRRQIPFTALIIGLLGEDTIDQVIVSSCILTDDETAVTQAEGIIEKVRSSTVEIAYIITRHNY